MPNPFEEFRTIVGALDGARVSYAICAGIAMSIHARARATIDIDVLTPPVAVEKIVDALAPSFGASGCPRGWPRAQL